MQEKEFVEKIKALGGKTYVVGGWVRDLVLHKTPKDKDYVIVGVKEDEFNKMFPEAICVGKSFPVYLIDIDENKAEVAFARKEEKRGRGYKGFVVHYAPEVTIEEDLYRRDTTMNSMAFCLENDKILDPYHGLVDLRNGLIRATSRHFLEDPVRALRAARQAAETGFRLSPNTIEMMKACRVELIHEPKERIVNELTKALASENPSIFFRSLNNANLLDITFKEIFDLIGKSQPKEYHPEGDAFEHSLLVLDTVAKVTMRVEVRFAALVHDLGKGLTRIEDLPHHYGHEKVGIHALKTLNAKLELPKLWMSCAEIAISEHMRVAKMKRPLKIVELLLKVEKHPIGFDGFNAIISADNGFLPEILRDGVQALAAIHSMKIEQIPKGLKGSEIGQWIKNKQVNAYCAFLKNKE